MLLHSIKILSSEMPIIQMLLSPWVPVLKLYGSVLLEMRLRKWENVHVWSMVTRASGL
jgi:hypothetical protein